MEKKNKTAALPIVSNAARLKSGTLFGSLFFATALCLSSAAVAVDEFPALKKGLWSYQRILSGEGMQALPKNIASKRCADPGEEMRKQNAMLNTLGCTLNPATRQDNRYSFVTECPASLGLATRMATTIIVDSDSVYRVLIDSEANVGDQVVKSHEELTATREHDC